MRNRIISYKMLIAKEEAKKSNFLHSGETLIKLSKSTSPSNRTDQCHVLCDTVRTTVALLCYLKINNMNPIINIGQSQILQHDWPVTCKWQDHEGQEKTKALFTTEDSRDLITKYNQWSLIYFAVRDIIGKISETGMGLWIK